MAEVRHCPACGATLPADAPMGLCVFCLLETCTDKGADSFGDYKLQGAPREGGMGVVYRVHQSSLNRVVALKMIRGGFLATADQVRRFRAEAEAAARLDHPNIVPIYEVGEQQGRQYFTMKWVEGGSLAERLARLKSESNEGEAVEQAYTAREAAQLVATIARAVHHAHQRGIIHRDLKPSNILLDIEGRPHITDFGLAKRLDTDAGLTLSGDALGTPSYMAPEQAAGKARDVTKAADVYSLGAILYEVITGKRPFAAETPAATLQKVLTEEPRRPSAIVSKISRDLETICLKCLEKEPARRYPSSEALADDLERWLRGEAIRARPAAPWERTAKWVRRHPVSVGLFAALLAIAVLSSIVVRQLRHGEQQGKETAFQSRFLEAERHFDEGNGREGLTTLAGILRDDPGNRIAAERLVNAMRQRVFFLPVDADRRGTKEDEAHHAALQARQPEISLSADGQRIITVSNLTNMVIRARVTDEIVRSIPGAHAKAIRFVGWGSGNRIVSAAADNTAKVWDGNTGQCLLTVTHPAAVNHAELSSDFRRLVTASSDNTAQIWQLEANLQPVSLASMSHSAAVNRAYFSMDEKLVVTASDDKTVRLWDASSGEPIREPLRLNDMVLDAFFISEDRQIRVFQLETNEVLTFRLATGRTIPDPTLSGVLGKTNGHVARRSPDGRFRVDVNESRARIVDSIGQRNVDLPDHGQAISNLCFSPDGIRIASSAGRRARVWDARTGLPLTDWITSPESITGIDFSADGRWLFLSGFARLELHIARRAPPPWLPDLAGALGRMPLENNDGPGPSVGLNKVRQLLFSSTNGDPLVKWAQDFVGAK